MDRENQIGALWSPELTSALARCRVFVPLYSPRYFESDNCGREWFAFARREITHRARGRQVVNAIVPALWTRLPPRKLPYVAQSVQFDHKFLGERYCAEGFYGIMKLHNYRTDYQRAVHRLAERIIAIGDESIPFAEEAVSHLPHDRTLITAQRVRAGQRTADGGWPAPDRGAGPRHLYPAPGRAPEYYGATPHTWSPYRPDYPQPLADYAQELAKKCLDCKPLVGAFDDDVTSWSERRASRAAQPVPGGSLGEPVGQAPGTAQSPGPGGRALGQRAGALEQPGLRDARGAR